MKRIRSILMVVSIVVLGKIALGTSRVAALVPSYRNYLPIVAKAPAPTPTPSPSPTPTSAPSPTPSGNGNIVIVDIHYNGTGRHEPDEYVVIRNDDVQAVDLANWKLRDEANHIYTFPAFSIQPGQVCRVYTNENHPEWCGFNYGSGSAIWNNSGDCAYLMDSSDALVDQYCY